jgi:hypothetical protein
VMLTPNSDGSYSPFTSMSTEGPFIPSGTVQVSGSGATVPAFHASLSFAGPLNLTSPQISGITAQLPSGDVPVTWSGGSPEDQLQLFLSANAATDSSKTANVTCVFSGGSGTVPASAMAAMANAGSLGAGPLATTSVTAGQYDVTIKVQSIDVVAIFMK